MIRVSSDVEVKTAVRLVWDLASRDWDSDVSMAPRISNEDSKTTEVGSYEATLFDLITLNSVAKAKLEKRAVDGLFRRISSRDHPDRGATSNAESFALAVKARKSGNLPVLYWLWVRGGGDYVESEILKMIDRADSRFAIIQGIVGRVVSAHVAGTDEALRKEALAALKNLSRRLTRKHANQFME